MSIRIAVTMGDPTGIGPEVILKALQRATLPEAVRPVVYGSVDVFRYVGRQIDTPMTQRADWIECSGVAKGERRWEDLRIHAGRLQVCALEAAVDAAVRGEVQAICTGPICKEAAARAGFGYPGHTEYLAERGKAPMHAMMLAGPKLRVVPLTGHRPLREVSASLKVSHVAATLQLTATALVKDFGIERPRVALTGLNPHAGEGGLLGSEERKVLQPALELARRQLATSGPPAELTGPLPADGLFAGAPEERFDAIVCCYHDQALIPFKMRHRDSGVNVTLGLPFVRTSPAHGTAFDIAGRGVASPQSMEAALQMAAALCLRACGSADPRPI